MAIVRTPAVLLKAIRFGDTSMIYRFFTRERGVVAVMARAARRPNSRFARSVEPFRILEITYHFKESREVQTLSGVDVISGHPEIVASLDRMEAAGRWLRVLRRVLPEGAPSEPVFDLVAIGLERLSRTTSERAARWEAYHLAAVAAVFGLAPDIARCVECERGVGRGERLALSIPEGGVVCPECSPRHPGTRTLSGSEYAHLNLYLQPDYELLTDLDLESRGDGGARRLIHDFVRYHMDVGPGVA